MAATVNIVVHGPAGPRGTEEERADWTLQQAHEEPAKQQEDAESESSEEGPEVNSDIFDAARRGRLQVVQACLQEGAEVNAHDFNGCTPLFHAARARQVEMSKWLVDAGSNLEKADTSGRTPLRVASFFGHEEIVQLLLTAGASLNTVDLCGWTPLHAASSEGYDGIARILLAAGADVNRITSAGDGLTPLLTAATHGHIDVVETLLSAGADPTVKGESSQTAREVAEEEGHGAVAELLRGAEEEWTRPFVLQLSVRRANADLAELTLRTMAGTVAAVVSWSLTQPIQELPEAVLASMRSSGFQSPFEPLRVSNLRLVYGSRVLKLGLQADPLADQLEQENSGPSQKRQRTD